MEYNKQLAYMEKGDEVEGFYILRTAVLRTASNGKIYLSASLADASGKIDAKMWDYNGKVTPAEEGKVVKIRGEVTEFKGSLQLNIRRIRLAEDRDNYALEDLVPTAPIDSVKEMEYVQDLIASLEDEDYRMLCMAMLDRHIAAFGKIPAAKNVHHSFLSGLLMHTSSMLRIADFLATQCYPTVVNRSLLLAGTLLHDFGKEREYDFSELGLVTDKSTEGMLIGHLVLGAEEVNAVGQQLGIPEEKLLLIRHMLLSHHGTPEFGAAVIPSIAEAELLSYIDLLDSRMEIYAETLETLPVGKFSDRIFSLDKRIYNHGLKDGGSEF
ncbi:MAG: HD domain-containing protein [Oscillospiraceae bacterium]|nr:HD domain-containing protein [Oscillospiraceae bacterium]